MEKSSRVYLQNNRHFLACVALVDLDADARPLGLVDGHVILFLLWLDARKVHLLAPDHP